MKNTRLFFRKIYTKKEILILVVLIIIPLYPLFLYPYFTTFPQTDINIYSAWKTFLVDSFKTYGYIPLWNPYYFSGAPFIGNSQVGIFYPINILYFFFPIDRVFGYIFLLDYVLIGLFTYFYARLIGLSKYASMTSGICITFNGAVMKQLFLGHIIIMDSLVWFPLMLYLFEKTLQKRLFIYPILSGILIGIMLLSGNSQIPIYSLLAATIYLYIRVFQEYKNQKKSLKTIIFLPIITLIIGIFLSAIQLMPTFEFSQLSARSHGLSFQFASDFSLHPKQLPVIIFPSLFGSDINNSYWGKGSFWASSIYSGILPFFLAGIAVFLNRNKYTYALLILLVFSVLFSFGEYGPIFKFFYEFIPFFNNFRVPTRFLFIYAFSFSILVGFGFDFILEKLKRGKYDFLKRVRVFISITLAILIPFYIFLYTKYDSMQLFEKIILNNSYAQGINRNSLYQLILNDVFIFFIFTSAMFVLVLAVLNFKSYKIFFICIILVIITDYFLFYSKYYYKSREEKNYNFSNEISFLKKDKSEFRIFSISNHNLELASKNKLENITGFDPLYLASYRDFLWEIGPYKNTPYESFVSINEIKNANNLRLLNVKYILSEEDLKANFLSLVYKGKYNIYKIDNSLPRSFISYQNNPNFNLENLNKIQEVHIDDYEPNIIRMQTTLDKPGYLILSEIYYPGWTAYDNNKQVEIQKSNKIFRSLYLDKGYHQIVFKYSPESYNAGKMVTSITGLIVTIMLIYTFKKNYIYKKQPTK